MYGFKDIWRMSYDDRVNWAMGQTEPGPTAKLILVEMARQCDSPLRQVVFNNHDAARLHGLTVKTVRKAVAELEALELISSRGREPMAEGDSRYMNRWKLEVD